MTDEEAEIEQAECDVFKNEERGIAINMEGIEDAIRRLHEEAEIEEEG